MNNSSQPSIFTAKESLKRKTQPFTPAKPLPPSRSHPTSGVPWQGGGSSHRRASTPEYIERGRVNIQREGGHQQQQQQQQQQQRLRSSRASETSEYPGKISGAVPAGTLRADRTLRRAAGFLASVDRSRQANPPSADQDNHGHQHLDSPSWPQAAEGDHKQSVPAKRPRSASIGPGTTTISPSSPTLSFLKPTTSTTVGRDQDVQPSGITKREAGKEPPVKKPKTGPKRRHILDSLSYAAVPAFNHSPQPPSPLFFSSSPNPRPRLPPRFSSSEAAAKMLGNTRAEESHVKTVSLARGLVNTPSFTPTPTSAPRVDLARRPSWERTSTGRSASPELKTPDRQSREGSNGLITAASAVLHNVGVTELLEQDERPTFIVDLAENTNYGSGPLHPIFMNTSLKSFGGMADLVTGPTSGGHSPGFRSHLQFKSWLLSAAVNGESLNVCLPAFSYAGMTWSCSTVRKRFRIIAGTFSQPTSSSGSAAPTVGIVLPGRHTMTSSSDVLLPDAASDAAANVGEAAVSEPSDYFGAAASPRSQGVPPPSVPAHSQSTAVAAASGVIPSVERSPPQQNRIPRTLSALNLPTEGLAGSTDLLPDPHMYVSGPPSESSASRTYPSGASPMSIGDAFIDNVNRNLPLVPGDAPSFDWTRLPVNDNMPPHIKFARSIDWAATSLGPIETWSSDLRQMCNLIMASPHPAAMYWGNDLIAIYNEAYILLAGQKHPTLMGQSYRAAWAEIWDEVKEVFANARVTGEATMKDDDCLFINRNSYLEETYFSWSIIPMVGSEGNVMGLYNPAFEKTRRKIAERRMLTLREVGERTASARDVKGFWGAVLGSFELNEFDSPFIMLYSATDEVDSDTSSVHSSSVSASRQCLLEGALGVPDGHPAAIEQIDLRSGMEGFGPVFREIVKTDRPVVLEAGSKDLPQSLLDGLDFRGFGDPVRAVVVCPIHPTTGENVLGFLVLGVNPRRPYDDDYSLFVQLLSRQLATSLASVVLFEEEIRRGQRAAKLAALDRIELSEQLAARTQEAIESETKFTRMAEVAPVGIFITDGDGKITYANDTWYNISRVPRNSAMVESWMDAVHDEDKGLVESLWRQLVVDTKQVSSEFRFKANWVDRDGIRSDTWVLFSAFAESYSLEAGHERRGKLKSIFGVMTNISQQKWAQGFQRRRMQEALELKRQQENFIDITSHEMRNPLSAILQCSDEITSTLTKYRQQKEKSANGTEKGGVLLDDDVIASCLDAAQTINLCSQHQKRIVDDILTLSKVDSQLLLVTPVDAQPLTVVQRALKMHEGELQAADIQMRFIVDQTFRDLNLDWVRFDPSRVLQVLINLTTNAIKFTTTERKRMITVTIAACLQRPSVMPEAPVKYFPTKNKDQDAVANGKDWGDGEKVYVHFAVRDTGRGLSPEEKKLLFIRFSQASPRTHVQYGGSGLGLFISRELTELQGGEIGVESEAGKGSTFAFYVVARRTAPPEATENALRRLPSDANGKKFAIAKAANRSTTKGSPAGNKVEIIDTADIVKKVLIVEDNLVNQRVLQKQLKNLGTEVHVANHGGEALEKLRQSTYWAAGDDDDDGKESGKDDGAEKKNRKEKRNGEAEPAAKKLELGVVLMDQEMPVMDGLTCTRKIRELEKQGKLTGHIPIIAVTANARSEQVQTALDAGMDDIICKPFKIPDLVPKIEELMVKFPMPPAS